MAGKENITEKEKYSCKKHDQGCTCTHNCKDESKCRKKETPEDLQQKYLQLEMMQQQMEQLSQHIELLSQQKLELNNTIDAVKGLSRSRLNEEILAPIANGLFIKAELKDNQKLVVNVGSDVTVEKNIPEVVELLEEQKEKIIKRINEAEKILVELQEQAMKIYREVSDVCQA